MLSKKLVGKRLVIRRTNGSSWLGAGKEYLVERIREDNSIKFKGIPVPWFPNTDNDFSVIDEKNESIEVGDTVMITEPTSSLKVGDERKVTGFVCDDKNKIIVEGTLPGGWVEPRKIVKKIDFSKIRVKHAVEFIKEYGLDFIAKINFFDKLPNIMGRMLDTIDVQQKGKVIVYNEGFDWGLHDDMVTEQPYEPLEILVTRDLSQINYYRDTVKEDRSTIAGKRLLEVMGYRKNIEDANGYLVNLSKKIHRDGFIKVGPFALNKNGINVVKKSEYESKKMEVAVINSPL